MLLRDTNVCSGTSAAAAIVRSGALVTGLDLPGLA
jgi:hypothetical protein